MASFSAHTFCVINLGCKVNRVESDTIAAYLSSQGGIQSSLEEADFIYVNTCTVTGEADKKCRKAIHHALSANSNARIIVTGCGVAVSPGEFAQLDDRITVVSREKLLKDIEQTGKGLVRIGENFRTRVGLKVQDGCNHACTYCIVHTARGRAWSKPFEKVIAEADIYLERGVKELVLTGIDLGSYRDGATSLHSLLDKLVIRAGVFANQNDFPARIRVSSIEPMSITSQMIASFANGNGRICRHMHIPLQSGSSKVLKEMNRPYDSEAYFNLIQELHGAIPRLSLSTDIIVGFPGETESDFQETIDLARACKFSKIHVFPYSKRAGTPAAERIDQIDHETKFQRARQLRILSDQLRRQDFANRKGTKELVLVEGNRALTESYHEIEAPSGVQKGSLVEVALK